MGVSRRREPLDVQNGQGGVGDGLAEDRLGVGTEGGVHLFVGAVGGDEGEVDSHLLHGDRKQVEGPAVDGAGRHDMVPACGNVEDGVEVGRLAGGGEHGGGSALQLGNFGRDVVVGGVLEASIKITAGLKVEELAHVLAGIVFEGGALNNGHLPRFAVARAVAPLYAAGVELIVVHADSS